ncbi:MAG: HD domain-containing protein [Desulfobacteraceae bacterium]|nr:MAG: HD domain-containing protein [Desulfobacteraceae bacterium]
MGSNTEIAQVSLIYACRDDSCETLEQFHADPAWRVVCEKDAGNALEKARAGNPDLVILDCPSDFIELMVETIQDDLRHHETREFALFASLDTDPGPDQRICLLDSGCDDLLIKPYLAEEIRYRVGVHLKKNELIRHNRFLEKQSTHAHQTIEHLKNDLEKVKEDLISEKDMLNSSLKQINQMTKDRDKLNKNLLELQKKFQKNTAGIGHILLKLIESGVEKYKGHAQRVAKISLFVANLLNISENEQRHLKTAALLHEVGLLLSPGSGRPDVQEQLNQLEEDFLVQYPVKGAELLIKCSQYHPAAEIIRYLNEHVDGTGYPEGLKKKHIPLLSRILAGSDALDSLYEQGPPVETDEILTTLENLAGQKLDPVVVNALEKYVVAHQSHSKLKVKGVGISDLKQGMTLAAGLFTRTGTKLFSVNTRLNEADIDKIVKYNREYPVEETVYIKA